MHYNLYISILISNVIEASIFGTYCCDMVRSGMTDMRKNILFWFSNTIIRSLIVVLFWLILATNCEACRHLQRTNVVVNVLPISAFSCWLCTFLAFYIFALSILDTNKIHKLRTLLTLYTFPSIDVDIQLAEIYCSNI